MVLGYSLLHFCVNTRIAHIFSLLIISWSAAPGTSVICLHCYVLLPCVFSPRHNCFHEPHTFVFCIVNLNHIKYRRKHF